MGIMKEYVEKLFRYSWLKRSFGKRIQKLLKMKSHRFQNMENYDFLWIMYKQQWVPNCFEFQQAGGKNLWYWQDFLQFHSWLKGNKVFHIIHYIGWEMTSTSRGGEKQAGISGGSQSPSWYSLRQDCRGAQEKYVMQLHDAHLAARMLRHSWM